MRARFDRHVPRAAAKSASRVRAARARESITRISSPSTTPARTRGPLTRAMQATLDAGSDAPPLGMLESTPPPLVPAESRVSVASAPLVFDPVRGGVWTANGDVGSVSYADVDRYALVGEIPVGTDIRSVALSPDGKWLAAVDRGGASVALIDADARAVIRVIPTGTHPRAAVWDAADPRWLYVAVEDDDTVAVIDRTLGVLSTTIPVGRLPSGVAVSRKRRELYVTHRIDGKVTIVPLSVDLDGGIQPPSDRGENRRGRRDARGETTPVTTMREDSWRSAQGGRSRPELRRAARRTRFLGDGTLTTPRGTPFGLESLAWAADGNIAWVPHELIAPTHPFQFQQVLFPTVSVVDLSQRVEVQTDPERPERASDRRAQEPLRRDQHHRSDRQHVDRLPALRRGVPPERQRRVRRRLRERGPPHLRSHAGDRGGHPPRAPRRPPRRPHARSCGGARVRPRRRERGPCRARHASPLEIAPCPRPRRR